MLRGGDEVGIWLNAFSDIVLYVLARYPRANTALDECSVELFAAGASSALDRYEARNVAQLQAVAVVRCLLPAPCQVRRSKTGLLCIAASLLCGRSDVSKCCRSNPPKCLGGRSVLIRCSAFSLLSPGASTADIQPRPGNLQSPSQIIQW